MPMRFDVSDLRLFLAIVEAGSITHGAAAANLSLPAASERLRDMEVTSRVKLLDRGRRGVTPTPAGEALAHHARLILSQIAHMQGELGEHARGIRATVLLMANTAAMTEFLPDRLGAWLAAHPRVDIDLKERQSVEIVKAISGSLAEIGIISDAVDSGDLELRPFAVDQLVVVMPRAHPLATTKRIAFSEILGQKYVGLAAGALQDHIDEQATRMGHKLKVRARLRTFEGICCMVARGVGIGIVPETAARRCRRSMPITTVRLTDDWAMRRLSLCFRAERELARPARDLLAHLAARSS